MTAGWEWVEIVAQLATPVALIFAIIQLIGARAAKHRDFENLYVQRYWNLMDSFERDPWAAQSVRSLPRKDRTKVLSYLQLCEDELDLRRNGFISTKTWDIWAEGMVSQCSRRVYADGLTQTRADELPSLRLFLLNHEDPLKMNPVRKWWTGIGYRRRK